MKTSGVSSRGEFKMNGGFEFVKTTGTVGVFVDGMSRLHAVRNDTARMHKTL